VVEVAVSTRNFLPFSVKFIVTEAVCDGNPTTYIFFQEVSCLLLGLFEASLAATMQCRLQLRTVFLGAELRSYRDGCPEEILENIKKRKN
jgi:hypothetical protein